MLSYLQARKFVEIHTNDKEFQQIKDLQDLVVWLSLNKYLYDEKIKCEIGERNG